MECLFPLSFFVCIDEKYGTCYMDAWNNVLDEHCDVTVICMDGTLFLIMYVCCHGWSYVLDTSYVCCACEIKYICISVCEFL